MDSSGIRPLMTTKAQLGLSVRTVSTHFDEKSKKSERQFSPSFLPYSPDFHLPFCAIPIQINVIRDYWVLSRHKDQVQGHKIDNEFGTTVDSNSVE